MQQPPSWSERLFARYYPRLAARAEDAGLREIRRRLISHASPRAAGWGVFRISSSARIVPWPAAVIPIAGRRR